MNAFDGSCLVQQIKLTAPVSTLLFPSKREAKAIIFLQKYIISPSQERSTLMNAFACKHNFVKRSRPLYLWTCRSYMVLPPRGLTCGEIPAHSSCVFFLRLFNSLHGICCSLFFRRVDNRTSFCCHDGSLAIAVRQ